MIRFIVALIVGLLLVTLAESVDAGCRGGCGPAPGSVSPHPVARRAVWRVFHPFAPIQPPARQ